MTNDICTATENIWARTRNFETSQNFSARPQTMKKQEKIILKSRYDESMNTGNIYILIDI